TSSKGEALLRASACVERLARKGLDTTEAQRTLDLFTRTLDIFEDDLRRILAGEKQQAVPPARSAMRLMRRAFGEDRTNAGLTRQTVYRTGDDPASAEARLAVGGLCGAVLRCAANAERPLMGSM